MGMPKPPDPYKTADAQSQINRDAATDQQLVNMVNQVDAAGNKLTYNQTGNYTYTDSKGVKQVRPQFTATQSLSGPSKYIYDTAMGAGKNLVDAAKAQSGLVGKMFGKPMNFNGIQNVGDFAGDRKRVEDSLMQRLNPQLEEQRSQAEARAIAKGLRPGSAAYDSEMSALGRNANDARLAAIGAAGNEQQRLWTQAMQGRQQAINEQQLLRSQPLNELSALMSGSQVNPQQMSFAQTPQASIAPADLMGAVQNNYNARMQSYGGMLGGLGGLFGGLLRLSDRRLKRDIVPIGISRHGLMEYAFRYLWSDQIHIGPMAQDMPAAHVVVTPSGFLAVDYGAVL